MLHLFHSTPEPEVLATPRSPIPLGRVTTVFAAAIFTLTACDTSTKTFVIPGAVTQTSKGPVVSCKTALAPATYKEQGAQPWFEPFPVEGFYYFDKLEPLPELFPAALPGDQAMELLLALREDLIQAHNSFVQEEGYGVSIKALKLDESDLQTRWELALYAPIRDFIEGLRQHYPSLFPCVLESVPFPERFGFMIKVISDFATRHGLVVDMTVLKHCERGRRVSHMGFKVDQVAKVLVQDTPDGIRFEEQHLEGKLSVVVQPVHKGVASAKNLLARVGDTLPTLSLKLPTSWKLEVHRGLSEGLANAHVKEDHTMVIESIEAPENLQRIISHEFGHMLNNGMTVKMDHKLGQETKGRQVRMQVHGYLVTPRRLKEALGEFFELWDVILTNGEGFGAQLENLLTHNVEQYQLGGALLLRQISEDMGYDLAQVQKAMQNNPKAASAQIARHYATQQTREKLMLDGLGRLDALAHAFLQADWSSYATAEPQPGAVEEPCE